MKQYILFALAMFFTTSAGANVQELIDNVKQKNLPAVVSLLEGGEDVNAKNEQGNTALHYAVAMDNAELTKTLLSYGADLNAENAKGWTPLKIAEKKQVENVAPIIEQIMVIKQEVPEVVQENTAQAGAQEKTINADEQVPEMVPLVEALAVIAEKDSIIQQTQDAKIEADEKIKVLEDKVAALEKENATLILAGKQLAEKEKDVVQKPAAPKPQAQKPAAPKPVVLSKSKLNNEIYAGDEEIVYCLSYLGHGENQHMLKAAEFYAASSGIKEQRYAQIAGFAEDYVSKAPMEALKTRGEECAKVITPQQQDKQNQVIHSLNKSIGY